MLVQSEDGKVGGFSRTTIHEVGEMIGMYVRPEHSDNAETYIEGTRRHKLISRKDIRAAFSSSG